ncbi:MAG: DUF2330 domain-containing protein [Planctomycetota bacterium]|jgi:HEAT repeat protein
MKMKPILLAIVLIFIFFFCRFAYADGVYIPEVRKKIPDIPVQRALLQYRDGVETLIIESTLDGEGDSYGWIIPLPDIPHRIEKFSPGLSKTLSLQVQPKIHQSEPSPFAFGLSVTSIMVILVAAVCFSIILWGWKGGVVSSILAVVVFYMLPNFIAYRSALPPTVTPLVEIKDRAIVGNYEIFILEAEGSNELDEWLEYNDFEKLPDHAAQIIDDYIADDWCFAVAKLNTTDEGLSTPHPVLFEFTSDRPVYPMKLTAVSGSTVYLELFVIADKEAVSIGYDIKKEYCDRFVYKEYEEYTDPYTRTGARVIKAFEPTVFSRGDKEIAHADALKVMWDGCVVTKFADKVSSKEMSDDLYLKFQTPQPYQSELYTSEAAFDIAFNTASPAFLIALICFTIYCRIKIKRRKSLSLSRPVSILVIFCVTVFYITYKYDREITDVVEIDRYWHQNTLSNLYACFSPSETENLTDNELLEKLAPYQNSNAITKEPLLLEDSPGNVAVIRKYGRFAGVNIYKSNGAPYRWNNYDFIQILEIEELISALKDEDPEVRMRSAMELGERNDPDTVPFLEAAFQDQNESVRNSAQIAILRITKDPRRLPQVAYALKDEDETVRRAAMSDLVELYTSGVRDPLIDVLHHKDVEIRRAGMRCLALSVKKDFQPAELFIAALQDPDFTVVISAVNALGRTKDSSAVDPLIALLEHEDNRMRAATIRTLGDIGDKRAVEYLIPALEDGDSKIQRAAVKALGLIKDRRALEPLVAVIKKQDWCVRKEAIAALGKLNDYRAVQTLIDETKGHHRLEAIRALQRMRDPRAVGSLIPAVKDKDSSVRRAAVTALGHMGDPKAVQSVIGATKDKNHFVRNDAAVALGKIGDSRASKSLTVLLRDNSKNVRKEAAKALGRIRDPSSVKALFAALDDEDGGVKSAVRSALRKITRKSFNDPDQWQEWWEQNK